MTQQSNLLRVMVDANVLVAGIAWPRFPYEVLQHATDGGFRLVLSPGIIEEARYTLAKIPPASVNVGDFEAFLKNTEIEYVQAPTKEVLAAHTGLVRDPKDIHVAVAAIAAKVDLLVTQDRDFTADNESTHEVRKLLNICVPGVFLREYMGWSSEALESVRTRMWVDIV
jgi:predicted nucleic acid-binding protein